MEAGQCLGRWNERENKKRCAEYAGHDNANDCSLGGPHLSTSQVVVTEGYCALHCVRGFAAIAAFAFALPVGMRLAVDSLVSGTYEYLGPSVRRPRPSASSHSSLALDLLLFD